MLCLGKFRAHIVQIDHGGKPVLATYSARTEIRTKTVGAKAPNRMDMQRCQWTATIIVDRALSHGPALARTVSSDQRFSGSGHGACTQGGRSAVRDPVKAARLRPDRAYWDWGVSVDYFKGRWFAGLRYADSSISGPERRHAGASVIGRLGLSL